MEWISVEDKRPEFEERVLICINETFIDVGVLISIEEYTIRNKIGGISLNKKRKHEWNHMNSTTENLNVTHWMPLPKPPKV